MTYKQGPGVYQLITDYFDSYMTQMQICSYITHIYANFYTALMNKDHCVKNPEANHAPRS